MCIFNFVEKIVYKGLNESNERLKGQFTHQTYGPNRQQMVPRSSPYSLDFPQIRPWGL